MEFISEHWITLLGGGSITGLTGWFLGGRDKQKIDLKSGTIDNEIKEIDYAEKVRDLYESILLKKDAENKYILEQAKEDRAYFREEMQSLRKKLEEQDRQITDLSLINAITKEAADSWEKKFNELQKEHDALKKAFDALKKSMK